MHSTSPDRVAVQDEAPSPELVARVRALLAQDAIVAMPTETVYGLAVRADSATALERLARLKGTSRPRPWTWHVGSRASLQAVSELVPLVRRLAQRYWPGPLTLVVRSSGEALARVQDGGWTGIRMPAHAATAGILAALDFPVVMTSANVEGEPPALTAESFSAALEAGVGLILDGGRSRLGEPSALLRVGRGHFELMREGLLPIADLRRTAGLRLLFVCTGNTCRSPMAEGIARTELLRRLGPAGGGPLALEDFGFSVASAGVAAGRGAPPSPHAAAVLATEGIDITEHRSRSAEDQALASADRIYGLTSAHLGVLAQRLPPRQRSKVQLLDPNGIDVPDPIGGSKADYRACARRIAQAIVERAADWA